MTSIPDEMVADDLEDLINFCFPPELFRDPLNNADAISQNAILCPKNSEVDTINAEAMSRMEGFGRPYLSIDTPLGSHNAMDNYRSDASIEAANNECPSGFPPHRLFLKV